jgi:hypothetical protein
MFTVNPFSVLEMIALGYVIAITVQTMLGFAYTRLGRDVLMTADDCWSSTYFGLTSLSWIVTVSIATFLSLPMVDALGKRHNGEIASLLALVLILLLFRNRSLAPRQQSIMTTLLFSASIFVGAIVGVIVRVRFPTTPY